jgi:hypothetical protein
MATYHVSLGFAQSPDATLNDFADAVVAGLTGNAAFPTPPVPLATLADAKDAFAAALTAAALGGPQATAAKNAARAAVVEVLRQLAYYVQGAMKNDLALLLSSGFVAADPNRAQSPLPPPVVLKIENRQSTQLVLQLKRVANAKAYEVQKMNGTGGWTPAGIFTQARRIVLEGLNPGSTYTVQARAIGGSSGYSDWSDPVSHMSL